MPRRTHPRKTRGRTRPRQDETWFESLDGSLFCPCGKMSGRTEQEAWDIALGIYAARGGERPQRVYACNDDGRPPFHWTRRP
jgi:hypothetical protein